MTRIIVLGAGIGGIPMAYELREKLGDAAEITVVSDRDYFHFVPSNPWIAIGWRKPEDIKVSLPDLFKKHHIGFVGTGVKEVVPAENAIILNDDTRMTYDYMVVATGPALAFDEIEGMGPERHTHSFCHVEHAAKMHERWVEFCKEPGPIVIGAVQGASCFGPAYEMALTLDTDLRNRKIRDQVPMTFVTSEPYIGHLGLAGVGDTKGMLESIFRDHDIKWITNAKIKSFGETSVTVEEMNDDGSLKKTHELPSSLSAFIPGFRGIPAFMGPEKKGIPNLTNPRGFILIDKYQRNPTYRNVFAVGVCVAIPPLEQTPVPVGVPKTGYMIESMVTAVAENIHDLMNEREPSTHPTWNAVCLADFGSRGVAFVAQPQIPPRNVNWASEGRWVHWAKVAFEKYFLYKIRHGSSEPIYEYAVMKLLGITKLRPKLKR